MEAWQRTLLTFLSTLPQGERLRSPCNRTIVHPYFYPRSRKGSDDFASIQINGAVYFYPRSRKGSDVQEPKTDIYLEYFYPRSRKGSDIKDWEVLSRLLDFYPRSRKGSDVGKNFLELGLVKFLSTLPQGERRGTQEGRIHVLDISIHAPARGATNSSSLSRECRAISIHAPARGATGSRQSHFPNASRFLSTLPQGERPSFISLPAIL